MLGASLVAPLISASAQTMLSARVEASATAGERLPLSATERAARAAAIREGLNRRFNELEKELNKTRPTPTVRDLTNGALTSLVLGRDVREAERMLRLVFNAQNMDAASSDYGNLPWQLGRPEINDANSIEFGMQAFAPLLLRYDKSFTPVFRQEMRTHVRAALRAIRRHKVPVSYTNIFLMKTANLILLGEATGEGEAASEGQRMLDEWIAYTRENGIHEFDSPTYYSVDLGCLYLGYLYAPKAETQSKFKTILDYFWSDIAANFFNGRAQLAAPYSRTYEFLTGDGGLNLHLFVEGLRAAKESSQQGARTVRASFRQDTPSLVRPDLEKIFLLENAVAPNGYRPDARTLAIAQTPERIIRSRWDADSARTRYCYITPDFAIGSADGSYNAQDQLISIALRSPKDLPLISFVADTFDAPYGKVQRKDRSGHNKPTHLALEPVSAQERGALLTLFDIDASRAGDDVESLATNVIIPARADAITLDGKPVKIGSDLKLTANENSIIAVREGASAVLIRFFRADSCRNQTPRFALQADNDGLKYGAARFTVYHYKGSETKLTEKHLLIGALIITENCRSDAEFNALLRRMRNAKIEQTNDGRVWQATAAIGDLTLAASRDLTTRRPIYKRVNGRDMERRVLSLNDTDLSAVLRAAS